MVRSGPVRSGSVWSSVRARLMHRCRCLVSTEPSSASSPLTLLQVQGREAGRRHKFLGARKCASWTGGSGNSPSLRGNRSRWSRSKSRRPGAENLRGMTIFHDPARSQRLHARRQCCSQSRTNRFQLSSATQNRRPGPSRTVLELDCGVRRVFRRRSREKV